MPKDNTICQILMTEFYVVNLITLFLNWQQRQLACIISSMFIWFFFCQKWTCLDTVYGKWKSKIKTIFFSSTISSKDTYKEAG